MTRSNTHIPLTDKVVIIPMLVLFALLGSLPFMYLVAMSVKTPVDAFAMPPPILFQPTFASYSQLLHDGEFAEYLWNSVLVTGAVVVISTVIGALGGYALARYRGIGSFALLTIALVLYSLPRTAILLFSRTLTRWISIGTRTVTWRSGRASTDAPGRTWPAWSYGWHYRFGSIGIQSFRSMIQSPLPGLVVRCAVRETSP